MAFKPITNPRGAIIRGKNGKAELIWNAGCAPRMNEMLSKKQEIIDSEVLRLCAPMVPKRTGALERSGTLHAVGDPIQGKFDTVSKKFTAGTFAGKYDTPVA